MDCSFIGDFDCKADSKWRVVVPAAFRRSMQSAGQSSFVAQKDVFSDCVNLYPREEWNGLLARLRAGLNRFNPKHAVFLREFCRGTQEVEMDANGRVLLPRKLLEAAGVGREMTLAGQGDSIQVWSEEVYRNIAAAPEELGALAEEIFKR